LEGFPHEAPFTAVREKQNVCLVFEDEVVCDVIVRSAGVNPSSTVEQSGRITGQIFSATQQRGFYLLKDVFVVVQDDYILGTELQSDDGTILSCPFMESKSID
jgi:hypothetical protein